EPGDGSTRSKLRTPNGTGKARVRMEAGRYGGCGQFSEAKPKTAFLSEGKKERLRRASRRSANADPCREKKKTGFQLTGAALSWKPPVAAVHSAGTARNAQGRAVRRGGAFLAREHP